MSCTGIGWYTIFSVVIGQHTIYTTGIGWHKISSIDIGWYTIYTTGIDWPTCALHWDWLAHNISPTGIGWPTISSTAIGWQKISSIAIGWRKKNPQLLLAGTQFTLLVLAGTHISFHCPCEEINICSRVRRIKSSDLQWDFYRLSTKPNIGMTFTFRLRCEFKKTGQFWTI